LASGATRRRRSCGRSNWRSQNASPPPHSPGFTSGARPTALVASLSASQRAEVAIATGAPGPPPRVGPDHLGRGDSIPQPRRAARFHTTLRSWWTKGRRSCWSATTWKKCSRSPTTSPCCADGVVVGSALTTREVTEQEVARRMLGEDVATLASAHRAPVDAPWWPCAGWPATQSGRWT